MHPLVLQARAGDRELPRGPSGASLHRREHVQRCVRFGCRCFGRYGRRRRVSGGDDGAVLEPSSGKALFCSAIEADAAFVCMRASLQTFPFRHCHVTFRDFASSSWIFRNRTRATAQLSRVTSEECTDDECSSARWLRVPPRLTTWFDRPRDRGRATDHAPPRESIAPRVHPPARARPARERRARARRRGVAVAAAPARRERPRPRVGPSPSTPSTPPPWWRTSSSHAPTRISRMASRRR